MLYQTQVPAADLPIFCISNLDYWEHRDRPKDEALPFLQLSGILQVRRHCLSLVAEGQLRAAKEYITNAIPALLGSIELWIQSGAGSVSAERKEAIRSALDEIERELEAVSVFGESAYSMSWLIPIGFLEKLTAPTSAVNSVGRTMERQFTEQITHLMGRLKWSKTETGMLTTGKLDIRIVGA